MVVLHHLLAEPELLELIAAIGLDKEAALVAEHVRLDQADAVDACLESPEAHGAAP